MSEILNQQQEAHRTNTTVQDFESQSSSAGANLKQQSTVVSDTVADIQDSFRSIQSTGQQLLAFLRKFATAMQETLRATAQTDPRVFTLLPQIHRDTAIKPTNLLETNIRFEGTLGRGNEPIYEYFRHQEARFPSVRLHFPQLQFVQCDSSVPEGFRLASAL